MKKIYLIMLILFFISFIPAFAIEKELNGKIGTSYAHELHSFGLDLDASYLFKLDPYFVAGFEGGFFWIPWEKKLGSVTTPVNKDIIADTNVYSVPMFLTAQVRIPFLVPKIYVEPSLTFGLGYNFLFLTYQQPSFTDSKSGKVYTKESVFDFYHGFAWQLYLSASYKPAEESRIKFTFDFGYRGSSPERTSEQVNMSGILMRLGVIFTFL